MADTNEEDVGCIDKLKPSYSYHLLVLHQSYIVHVLFVSDTNLDCNMVQVPYAVWYHNTVTSSNPGKNHPALTTELHAPKFPRIGNNKSTWKNG